MSETPALGGVARAGICRARSCAFRRGTRGSAVTARACGRRSRAPAPGAVDYVRGARQHSVDKTSKCGL